MPAAQVAVVGATGRTTASGSLGGLHPAAWGAELLVSTWDQETLQRPERGSTGCLSSTSCTRKAVQPCSSPASASKADTSVVKRCAACGPVNRLRTTAPSVRVSWL